MPKTLKVSTSSEIAWNKAKDWVSRQRRNSGLLVLARTRGAADDFARNLVRSCPGMIGIHRMTLPQLAGEIATTELARRELAPLTPLGTQALVARVVFASLKQATLRYFAPVAAMPGFVFALSRTLRELRLESVDPIALASSGLSGRDLATLLEEYQNTLSQSHMVDAAGVLGIATELCSAPDHRLLGLPLLLLDAAPQSLAEKRFLAALAQRSEEVLAVHLKGDLPGVQALEAALGVRYSEWETGDPEAGNRLAQLRKRLFVETPVGEGTETTLPDDGSFEFFSAPGEERECVEIARRILELTRNGVRFDQMAVGVRSPEIYMPLIEDALRRAGIPGYFSRGTLRPDPSGRAFLALLDCAAEGLSASKFSEYLSLAQVPVPDEAGRPKEIEIEWVEPQDGQLSFKTPVPRNVQSEKELAVCLDSDPVLEGSLRTPARWEQLIVDAAVIGGKERWKRRLAGLEAEFEIQWKGLDEDDETARTAIRRRVVNLRHLEAFALPLIGFLDSIRQPACWGEWLDSLQRLAGLSLKQPESILSVLAELSPMSGVGPVDLEEVRSVLAARLSNLRTEPPRHRYGAVFVATLEELVGRCFEVVFVPGLAEGIFPRRTLEDPLLLDGPRREAGLKAALESSRLSERLLLQTAVATAAERLFVSYPRMDTAQNRPRVPSFYAFDLLKASEGALPDLRLIERRSGGVESRLGWPAPADPLVAVDNAEFDLAILDPLLRKGSTEIKGKGRFLLSANPWLAGSLRTRARRWKNFFSPADGIVDPPRATLEILERHRLRQRSYSPTSLQHYAVCPYRFLLYSVLGLRAREQAVAIEQMDPLTFGGLFHEIQFEFFKRMRDREALPVTPKNLAFAWEICDAVLSEMAVKYEEELAPAVPRLWKGEIEKLRADLRGWLHHVAASGERWVPRWFEYAFGLARGSERDSESRPEEAKILNGMRLRGSIDLIEISPGGETIRVTDHKTGRPPGEGGLVVKGGEILQPLLYALAAEQLLGQQVESGDLFYCTQKGDYRRVSVPVAPGTCEKFKTVLEAVDRTLETGFLPAAPREDACSYCDYRAICGPNEELRIKRKLPERLKDLETVRALP